MIERELLAAGLAKFDLELTDKQADQFQLYYEMLIEKNKVMNLTAITEPREVVVKHFIDSLALVKALKPEKDMRILDLGTGAGFPGIPLKIMFPESEFVLADSLNKRINFINEVIDACRLEKITAVHGRAEELARDKKFRETFDLSVSRAVANLSSLCEYCLPFIKKNGRFVSYKSTNVDIELENAAKAIHILGGEVERTERFILPETEGTEEELPRTLVVIKKVAPTPKKYPRKAGTPSKDPL